MRSFYGRPYDDTIGNGRCPTCKSQNIDDLGALEWMVGGVMLEMICYDCNDNWWNEYKFARFIKSQAIETKK